MERPRVLVVEDRPSVLKLMATILEKGYEVTTAADGAAALSAIGSARLDAVLTDIRMPGLSGFDVLRAVQSLGRRIPVVMMTAYANVPDAVSAMKLGAYDYVAKPLDADEISLVLARAIEHSLGVVERGEGAGSCSEAGSAGADVLSVSLGFRCTVEQARDRASHEYLVRLMRLFRGNVTQAAMRAGMTRESLHRVLRKYGVQSEHHRDPGATLRNAS